MTIFYGVDHNAGVKRVDNHCGRTVAVDSTIAGRDRVVTRKM